MLVTSVWQLIEFCSYDTFVVKTKERGVYEAISSQKIGLTMKILYFSDVYWKSRVAFAKAMVIEEGGRLSYQ